MSNNRNLLSAWVGGFLLFAGVCLADGDASLATGRNFAPFVLALKPALQMSPLPGWMTAPAVVHEETATIDIPIPALWASPAVEFYALTVVFDDCGDGGPAVEWRAPDGSTSTISQGLGEWGTALGLNARTILLPESLTRNGGVLLVSYYAKFSGLLSLAVRPARGDLLAVLGGQSDPVLVDEALRVFERGEADGRRMVPVSGDVRRGAIVEAELSAPVAPFDRELEFVVPIDGAVEGAMIRLDVLGLDPEARIEVRVNALPVGQLSFPPFRLDDPSLVPDDTGRLILAGWRAGSLFLPARLWLQGDNSVVLTWKRSDAETGRPVFVRNSALHLRFSMEAPQPIAAPDLLLPDPLVPDPESIPLPEIITGIR
ncbi:MAG: hypothetical protein WCS31_17570 [Verrucomicrobiae bacterium]